MIVVWSGERSGVVQQKLMWHQCGTYQRCG